MGAVGAIEAIEAIEAILPAQNQGSRENNAGRKVKEQGENKI